MLQKGEFDNDGNLDLFLNSRAFPNRGMPLNETQMSSVDTAIGQMHASIRERHWDD
jgi:hypothetical protein